MGENDVQVIREDLVEVKRSLTDLSDAVADLRVLVAGNYVTKADFHECQKCAEARVIELHKKIENHVKEEKADRWKLAALMATVTGIVFGVIQWVVNLFQGSGTVGG